MSDTVRYTRPAKCRFEVERITETGGYQKTGGQGRSCWGYNHANIIRHRDDLYALCWRDDLSLVVFRRRGPGDWEASPPLPEALQSGVLVVDTQGRLHVIGGENASYHALFDPPGQVQRFTVERHIAADSRFTAAIAPNDDIFVVGGYPRMRWYVLSAKNGYRPIASGERPHETWRAYYFAHFDGKRAQTYCYCIQHVEGVGYQTLWTYYYDNPDLLARPDDWRMSVLSDVGDTFDGKAARGNTSNEDFLVDRKERVHLLYQTNRQPGTGTWPSEKQDRGKDELWHAWGPPGGPFERAKLGNFSRGRIYQTKNGRFHFLLERGPWFHFDLYYGTCPENDFSTLSEPVRLETPGPIDHVFVNARRTGGTATDSIDCYFTGPYPGQTNRIYYAQLIPGGRR